MRTLFATLLALSISAPAVAQELPSDTDIHAWAAQSLRDKTPEIDGIMPILLKSGEQAFLISVNYPNQGRNFWAGYLLARPELKQVIELEDFGGQYNDMRSLMGDEYNSSIVVIGSSNSGQGYQDTKYSIVSFDGWNVKTLHEVEESNNLGDCGEVNGKECRGSAVFINTLDNATTDNRLALVITNVQYTSPDPEKVPYRYSHEAKTVFVEK